MSKNRTIITPELEERIKKVRKKAREYLIKTEVVQFRLDEQTYRNLFAIAERERKPVGTLVREWVTNQVKEELIPTKLGSISRNTNKAEIATMKHVTALQKQIDELKKANQNVGFHF